MDGITDPSREIASLIDFMLALAAPASPQQGAPPMWKVLSEGLGLPVNSAEFLDALSAARRRLEDLRRFVQDLDDPSVGADVINHMSNAIHRFANAFSPAHANHDWPHVLTNWVQAADATTFRMFSQTMVRYKPLKALSDDDRQAAVDSIRAAIGDIDKIPDLDFWKRAALKAGYQRIELELMHFRFFGHDALSRDIVLARSLTNNIQASLTVEPSCLKKMWEALKVASAIVTAVTAPSQFHQALDDYSKWIGIETSIPSQPLLPPPTSYSAPSSCGTMEV